MGGGRDGRRGRGEGWGGEGWGRGEGGGMGGREGGRMFINKEVNTGSVRIECFLGYFVELKF